MPRPMTTAVIPARNGRLDEAIKINPHYALAFYNRANARLDEGDNEGDNEGDIADYREAININPSFEQAADMLKKLKKAKP